MTTGDWPDASADACRLTLLQQAKTAPHQSENAASAAVDRPAALEHHNPRDAETRLEEERGAITGLERRSELAVGAYVCDAFLGEFDRHQQVAPGAGRARAHASVECGTRIRLGLSLGRALLIRRLWLRAAGKRAHPFWALTRVDEQYWLWEEEEEE
jgi:hypothetical protein